MVLSWLLGTPTAAIFAWYFWIRDSYRVSLPRWRSIAFLVGLIAGSLNVLIYSGWLIDRATGDRPEVWRAQDFAGNIAIWLCPVAFVGAAVGDKGRASVALSISAVMGFMLWVPIGIL